MILIILVAALLLPLVFVIGAYNGLVGLRNHVRESWSDIDTELKRRYELIPNLVGVVKGYAAHEAELLERVTQLRNQCSDNHGAVAAQASDERELVKALQQLLVVVERYPDLKANEHFARLQKELVNTEDRIQASRRFYNGNVRDYRNRCEKFPSNIIAGLFGFQASEYFSVSPAVRDVPDVDL